MNGHEPLVKLLLDMGANPVPYEVGAQYRQDTYWDWLNELRERGYRVIVETIETALFGLHRFWRKEEKLEILDVLLKNGAENRILIR